MTIRNHNRFAIDVVGYSDRNSHARNLLGIVQPNTVGEFRITDSEIRLTYRWYSGGRELGLNPQQRQMVVEHVECGGSSASPP